MNSLQLVRDADIGRVLYRRVVKASSAHWPHLEITTPQGVFHLVAVESVISAEYLDNTLVAVSFLGHPPMGRPQVFSWPSTEVGVLSLEITALGEYARQDA